VAATVRRFYSPDSQFCAALTIIPLPTPPAPNGGSACVYLTNLLLGLRSSQRRRSRTLASVLRRAAESPAEARRAFLAVMAWGYGRVGYGPFRVRRLLDAAPDAGAELQAAASALREAGPVAAYARLGDHGVARLAGLGPAFGTKFLYFCSPAGDQPALILDRLMSRWLRDNAGLAVNEIRWSVSTYRRYLASMYGWAGELAVASDELEMCIFSEQAGLAGSQWA
jgi:hypothetical protein